MKKQNYSIKNLKENMAKAVTKDAPVSWKTSVEVVKFLKGKTTKQAKAYLEKVLDKKLAIPFTRFTADVGHRKGNGIATGRYPQKLSKVIISLLNNVEANASVKGLGENLKIIHFVANRASVPMHYGRHARREMKRTHIELIVQEVEEKKKSMKKKSKKSASNKKTSSSVKTEKKDTVKKEAKSNDSNNKKSTTQKTTVNKKADDKQSDKVVDNNKSVDKKTKSEDKK